jgi:hypothetical protein
VARARGCGRGERVARAPAACSSSSVSRCISRRSAVVAWS